MKLILKGFIIGVAKIIPGLSGAILAIAFGVYEPAIKAFSNFFENPIENFKYLSKLGIGALLAIILTSKLLLFLLNSYYAMIMLFFIGLIAGGIKQLTKQVNKKNLKISNCIALFLSFIFVISLTLINNNSPQNINNSFFEIISYLFIGSVDAITMIIPGISGTAVMMLLGVYDSLLSLLSNVDNIINSLNLYIPYILGVIITIITLSKLISYLFIKKNDLMNFSILGFTASSTLLLLIDLFINYDIKIYQISFFIIGIYISNKLEKFN